MCRIVSANAQYFSRIIDILQGHRWPILKPWSVFYAINGERSEVTCNPGVENAESLLSDIFFFLPHGLLNFDQWEMCGSLMSVMFDLGCRLAKKLGKWRCPQACGEPRDPRLKDGNSWTKLNKLVSRFGVRYLVSMVAFACIGWWRARSTHYQMAICRCMHLSCILSAVSCVFGTSSVQILSSTKVVNPFTNAVTKLRNLQSHLYSFDEPH